MTAPDAATTEFRQLNKKELTNLALILGCEKISPKTVADLRVLIQSYLKGKERLADPPQTISDDSNLRKLNQRAAALQEVLAALQEADLERMAAATGPGTKNFRQILKKMESQLVEIAKVSEEAIESAQDSHKGKKGDPSGGEPLEKLIIGLMAVFERETEKEAGNSWHPTRNVYFGPFYDFVKAMVDIVEPQKTFSNNSLGSLITQALIAARELSGNFLMRKHGRSSRAKPVA